MPHIEGHKGRTRGEALINRGITQRKYIDEIEDYQDEQQDWLDDKSSKSGWGRFFGAVIAGGIVAATGGTAAPIAIAAGVGSRVGNEGGEWLADRNKPTELDEDRILYYKDEVKQIKRDEERFEKDFDRRQWFDAARDAWTAYTLSSSAAKYGAEVETLADGSKVYAEQKPIEGLSKMWGDSGDWLKDLKSGSWGKGKELGEVASITPRSGDLNRRGVPYAGDPTSGVAKKTVKKYIQPLSSAAGNTAKTLARGTIAENSAKELARLSAEILGKDYTVNNLINSAENSFEVDPNAYNAEWGMFFNTGK